MLKYGTFCRECCKNLNIRALRKWFRIKSGCEEAPQVVPACNRLTIFWYTCLFWWPDSLYSLFPFISLFPLASLGSSVSFIFTGFPNIRACPLSYCVGYSFPFFQDCCDRVVLIKSVKWQWIVSQCALSTIKSFLISWVLTDQFSADLLPFIVCLWILLRYSTATMGGLYILKFK